VGVAFGHDDDRLIVTREDGLIETYSTDIEAAVALGRVPDLDLISRLDVGTEVGIPDVRGPMIWVGTRDRLTIAPEGRGGAIGVPLDRDEVADFARTTLARELTEAECLEYLASLGSGSCPSG
jgi:hypothetical protein